jgi:hypothetical protein
MFRAEYDDGSLDERAYDTPAEVRAHARRRIARVVGVYVRTEQAA